MDIKVNTVSKSVMLISIFISRRSSSPDGNHIHQYQHAGDAEDEFTHLCDLIDFAAEMNFKLDDINKHSFNEFQLRCCCFFFYKILSSVVSITNHHQALFQRVPTQVFYLQFCHQYYNSPPSTETNMMIIIIIKTNVLIVIIIINQDRHCCRGSCLRGHRSHKTSV